MSKLFKYCDQLRVSLHNNEDNLDICMNVCDKNSSYDRSILCDIDPDLNYLQRSNKITSEYYDGKYVQ